MINHMKRISVIGCPGAGKSTFSRELAQIVGLPLVHLDMMYHDQLHQYDTDRESWRARVLVEVEKKRWIIDGNYKSTFDIRLPESDLIIYLDYPTYLCIWRAVKRRIQFRKTVRKDMPSTWKEQLNWDFFVFILKFNHSIAPRMRQLLKTYTDKDVVVLRSPRQAKKYLINIHQTL
jgi:adenylate kinase family enzyme